MADIQEIIRIREKVKQQQKPSRYEHTLGVAYTAACMAFVHGEDPLKAELAGILHDCAKGCSNEDLIRLCDEKGIPLSDEMRRSPAVIHALYGRYMAEEEFGIRDEEILLAIENHTTGRPAMGLLEKIIFVADFIEPLRSEAPHLEEYRKLAFRDLDLCVYRILEATVNYLQGKGAEVVSATLEAYEYYRKLNQQKH